MKITKNKNGGLTVDGLGRTVIHLVEGIDGNAENFKNEFPSIALPGIAGPNNVFTGFIVHYHKDEETLKKAVDKMWK